MMAPQKRIRIFAQLLLDFVTHNYLILGHLSLAFTCVPKINAYGVELKTHTQKLTVSSRCSWFGRGCTKVLE